MGRRAKEQGANSEKTVYFRVEESVIENFRDFCKEIDAKWDEVLILVIKDFNANESRQEEIRKHFKRQLFEKLKAELEE